MESFKEKDIDDALDLAESIHNDIKSYEAFSMKKVESYLFSLFIIISVIWLSSFVSIEENGEFDKFFLLPSLLLTALAVSKVCQTHSKSTGFKVELRLDAVHLHNMKEIIKKEMESDELSHIKKAIIEIRLKRIGALD